MAAIDPGEWMTAGLTILIVLVILMAVHGCTTWAMSRSSQTTSDEPFEYRLCRWLTNVLRLIALMECLLDESLDRRIDWIVIFLVAQVVHGWLESCRLERLARRQNTD